MTEETDYSSIPGTWAYELEQPWKAFNACVYEMWEYGHDKKVPYLNWREYVLWDMQRKHNEEKDQEEKMKSGYIVEYSDDRNEICIIPYPHIPFNDFIRLVKMYGELGYKWWLPADKREGYVFAKNKKDKEEK
jgi:hypothetical protein